MAWNHRTDEPVLDEDVSEWENRIKEEISPTDIVHYLFDNWFGIDDKTTFLYDLAEEYGVELPVTEEDEDE